MYNLSILVKLEARPGKELEVEAFLRSALPLALAKYGTTTWFAFKTVNSTFGIFDTFADEVARQTHLGGEMAKALMARADELFLKAPEIELSEILAVKPHASNLND